MKLLFLQFIFVFFLISNSDACKIGQEKINKFFESRKSAFNQARRDAKIPANTQPFKTESVPLHEGGHSVMDSMGNPIMTRQYYYKNTDGVTVVIQEHTFGHELATRAAGGMPHFNVRPIDNLRTGKVSGTASHYNIGDP